MTDPPPLSTAIRARRKQLRLTQAALAKATGLSDATIRRLESGEQDDTATLRGTTQSALERALQWKQGQVDDILAGTADPASLVAPGGGDASRQRPSMSETWAAVQPLLVAETEGPLAKWNAGMAAVHAATGEPAKWGPVPLSRSRNAVGEALMLAVNTDPPVPEAVKLLRSALDVMLDADSKTGS